MRRKNLILTATAMTVCLLAAGCSSNQTSKDADKDVTLTISAAASAQDALEEIQNNYEKTHSNITIQDNYGSSGALQNKFPKAQKPTYSSRPLRINFKSL